MEGEAVRFGFYHDYSGTLRIGEFQLHWGRWSFGYTFWFVRKGEPSLWAGMGPADRTHWWFRVWGLAISWGRG